MLWVILIHLAREMGSEKERQRRGGRSRQRWERRDMRITGTCRHLTNQTGRVDHYQLTGTVTRKQKGLAPGKASVEATMKRGGWWDTGKKPHPCKSLSGNPLEAFIPVSHPGPQFKKWDLTCMVFPAVWSSSHITTGTPMGEDWLSISHQWHIGEQGTVPERVSSAC